MANKGFYGIEGHPLDHEVSNLRQQGIVHNNLRVVSDHTVKGRLEGNAAVLLRLGGDGAGSVLPGRLRMMLLRH